ncbi:MAG: OsmC family protein [Rhodospirillaceae bacterium]
MSRGTRPGVSLRQLDGKRLLGIARTHAVVTDRPVDEGGTDTGFTSGELLLLAIGSCCTGSLRGYLEAQGKTVRDLEVTVHFEPAGEGVRDRIVITLKLDARDYRGNPDRIKAAAVSGGVASRLCAGSDVEVRFATEAS